MSIPTVEQANKLAVDNLPLVQSVVNQVAGNYPSHVDREELWNAGAEGLVDASRRYDVTSGIPFARYAAIRIRGAIVDSTRARDFATRGVRRRARATGKAVEEFIAANGREPTEHELALQLGISDAQLQDRRNQTDRGHVLQLDQAVGDPDETTYADLLEETDQVYLPEPHLEARELLGTLRTAIDKLPETYREVVTSYFFAGRFLRDIADDLGVTEARVSQIRGEALAAIRGYFGEVFENVAAVNASAPGRRRREVYIRTLLSETTWRSRLAAADMPSQPPRVAIGA